MKATFVAALLTAWSAQAFAAEPDAQPFGDWWTPGFGARVRVEPCGADICGRIVWVWDAAPDIADKSPLVGRKVVDGMRPLATGRWNGGRLYNPEDGRHYQGSMHLRSAENLVVEGCVLMICKKQVWRRVDEGICPPADR
jgi:Delta7-sterol 5-desaturase